MEMNHLKLSWVDLESNLRKVKRYGRFKTMFYRTDLAIHSKRVERLLEWITPEAQQVYPELIMPKARLIARHHDDPELITGDVPLQEKYDMGKDKRQLHLMKELSAVNVLAQAHPKKIEGYSYKEILLHSIYKDCPEAQLVSFVDKIDGFCEAVHETLAGNLVFFEPALNYQRNEFRDPAKTFPLIKRLFTESKAPFFDFGTVHLAKYFENGEFGAKLHTVETIKRVSGIPQYEVWKDVTLTAFPNGQELLTKQVEFYDK